MDRDEIEEVLRDFMPDSMESERALVSSLASSSPARRKATARAKDRTGRSAFVSPICEAHPVWEDENGTVTIATEQTHCAKFCHLPGRGRGVYQPSFGRVIGQTLGLFVKPAVAIALLLGALLVLSRVLSGGLLQSGDPDPRATCTMPDGSVVDTTGYVYRANLDGTCRPYRGISRGATPTVVIP